MNTIRITISGPPNSGKTALLKKLEAHIDTLHLPAIKTYHGSHHALTYHMVEPFVKPHKPTIAALDFDGLIVPIKTADSTKK